MYEGIPYMGSKRKIAPEIIKFIISENPNVKYVYDLFGGGGAMTFAFAQVPQIEKVFYNEKNRGVVSLLEKLRDEDFGDEYYQWIDRDEFHKYKNGDCWKGGLVKTCWSFGNGQRAYLYGKDIEGIKKAAHHAILFSDKKSIKEIETVYGELQKTFYTARNKHERETEIKKNIGGQDGGFQQQNLECVRQLKKVSALKQTNGLFGKNVFEKIMITCGSYDEVDITTPEKETLIYLDPPYENTGEYAEKITHEKLYEYINKSKYKIYLSSYESPLKRVLSIAHTSTLSANGVHKATTENLYTNER